MTDFKDEIETAGYVPSELLAEFYAIEHPFADRFYCDFVNYFSEDEIAEYLEHMFTEYDYKPADFKRF